MTSRLRRVLGKCPGEDVVGLTNLKRVLQQQPHSTTALPISTFCTCLQGIESEAPSEDQQSPQQFMTPGQTGRLRKEPYFHTHVQTLTLAHYATGNHPFQENSGSGLSPENQILQTSISLSPGNCLRVTLMPSIINIPELKGILRFLPKLISTWPCFHFNSPNSHDAA